MLLNETSLVVPLKIRQLLNKHNIGVIFLKNSKFKHMLNIWGMDPKTIAVTAMRLNLILVNTCFIRKNSFSQEEFNYILLHEIGHAHNNLYKESSAHRSALALSGYYKIPIDYKKICLEEVF